MVWTEDLDTTHYASQNRVTPLNMDITGHFEAASCVIEVDESDTLAQVKRKLVVELGVPGARPVGVRMRGGGDIGNDDLRICDTVIDEGCAVELYCTGANITPGVIPRVDNVFSLTLSPCDRYLAVMWREEGMSIFDTETHERLCHFRCLYTSNPAFSPCSEWISCVNEDTECAEVHHMKTGALEHSFGDVSDPKKTTAWSPCGTKLLSCGSTGLQVWDIATGVVVHEWDHIVACLYVMLVTGDRVAMFGESSDLLTTWDYTTGVEVRVLTFPSSIHYVALSPNQRFIAACGTNRVLVWNIETGEHVLEDDTESYWTDMAVSDDIVTFYSPDTVSLYVWSISTGEQRQLPCHVSESRDSYGIAVSSCGGLVMYGGDDGVNIVDTTLS